jgi:HD-GYP domain-containing protein (c-di-GMP phosphodiesterase class II)
MNEVAADDTEPSSAFLQAVVDLGAAQTVTTSQAIFNAQGVKLLEGGAKVDQDLYDRLVSHRLSQPLDECVRAESSVDGKLLREAAQAAMERWPFFAQLAPTAMARESLLRLIAALPLPRPIALHLDLARNSRPGLFTHAILMALLCAYLAGQSEGSTRDDVADAAAAGLLHDLGMLHIDPALLDADERLSGNRLNPVYAHPLTASMLVERFDAYPKTVARAVVEHHERLDGSGYPRGLVGEAISPLGRVVALAEVVTAMFDGERAQPEQRVSLLLRINPRRYDPVLAAAVHRLLAALPASEAGAGDTPQHSIARLLRLADELERWRETSEAIAPGLDGAHGALLVSMNEQHATLQRMLYDAGVTHEQLGALGDDIEADAAMRIELWALAEELLWQLHSAANQLKRRWQATEPALPHPPALAAWFTGVASLDEPPVASR